MATFTTLGGRLTLEDTPPRPTEDPLWLAASIPPLPAGSHVLDAGTGSGIAALALLTRQPHLHVTALDIDPTLTALATRNAALNNLPLTTFTADILTLTPRHPSVPTPFDTILSNPPYHGQERGHSTPNAAKAQAHSLPANHLTLWLRALTSLLTPTGTLHLILHSACEAELTAFAAQLHTLTITPLQTAENRPAKRLLATLQKSANPEATHLPAIQAYNPQIRANVLG